MFTDVKYEINIINALGIQVLFKCYACFSRKQMTNGWSSVK